jgi:hypothetical protein
MTEPTTDVAPSAAQHAAPPAAARPRLWWRLPRAWGQRTDWVSVDTPLGQVLRGARWAAIAVYFAVLIYNWHRDGVPFDRDGLLLWIAVGLGCFCIGRHPVWLLWLAIDFLPFALVLLAYDYLRGISDTVGMPTWWTPQLNVDKLLFFGTVPTVWLQEHLKHARPVGDWYDLGVTICYCSFFFLPYVVAGVMWLRSRADFYRWSLRFVSLSFLSFGLFLLVPTAPPWAAALCSAKDVADHPSYPVCMRYPPHTVPGNLLGDYHAHIAGADPYVQRIALDAFRELHLGVAHSLWTRGFLSADLVAAVPSLHVGGTVLFCLFMWSRLSRGWRWFLAAYPLVMMFSLAYAGEHYISDGIAGALCAWFIHWAATRIERWQSARRRPDTLEPPPETTLEPECPPSRPRETTPSST